MEKVIGDVQHVQCSGSNTVARARVYIYMYMMYMFLFQRTKIRLVLIVKAFQRIFDILTHVNIILYSTTDVLLSTLGDSDIFILGKKGVSVSKPRSIRDTGLQNKGSTCWFNHHTKSIRVCQILVHVFSNRRHHPQQ